MTIKLIRTDTTDPSKIQLPLGEHIIGRGKLLECDDKRISRQHGKLEVSDSSLTIKALHQNPCFFIKNGTTDTEILRQDNSITLCNGDRFGLLPDAFWFEIIVYSNQEAANDCDTEECDKNTEEYGVECNEVDNKTTTDASICDKSKTDNFNLSEDFNVSDRTESPSLIGNNDPNQVLNNAASSSLQTITESESNCLNKTDKAKESTVQNEPHEINPDNKDETNVQNEPSEQSVSNEPSVQSVSNEQSAADDPKQTNTEEQNNGEQSPNSAVKRSHSPDNIDVKKIKTEPVEVKTEKDDVKPGPSLDQGQVPAAQPTNDGAPSANNAAPNKPLRERCMYGINCYRRNPQHLSQFSHPRDNDWGQGARGVCPYGAGCLKVDPRHWRDHDHPPGTLPQARPGMQVVQKHGNVFFINARAVNFYDDHFQVEDSDGDSVDFDYEF